MAKVLLVDTGFSAHPIYTYLCSLGFEVHVVGGNPNDCLAKMSNHYWNIDYSDIDKLTQLISLQCYDFLVPGCTDQSYHSCVEVNQGQFPGLETVENDIAINNKAKFREISKRIGLPVPNLMDENCLTWPLVVKPVDAYSGRGITIIERHDHEALSNAIRYARESSRLGEFIIETFIPGDLHSHTAFIYQGKVITDFIVQENATTNQFTVDTSRLIKNPSDKLITSLRHAVEKLAYALQLKDGLIHTQFIISNGEPWLIEITRRCPGDLYSQLIELSTGYPYIEAYVAPFLGRRISNEIKLKEIKPVMRHTITVANGQPFGNFKFNTCLNIIQMTTLRTTGDYLKPSPYSRAGVMFISARSEDELEDIYQLALNRNLYEIQS